MEPSGPERSLSGMSLPQWMKSKINDRYDLDHSTFSPPSEDDSFFHIRYQKKPTTDHASQLALGESEKYRTITQVLQQDFSHHTAPCKQFIPAANATLPEVTSKPVSPPLPGGRIRSAGTDDGFKGEGAACGQSVVAVAHQMIAGKCPKQRGEATAVAGSQRRRRNSKSLPASPRSSPPALRKNPFFAGAILGSMDALERVDSGIESEGEGGGINKSSITGSGWLLSILGPQSRDSLEELNKEKAFRSAFKEYKESLDHSSVTSDSSPPPVLRAKPSQLREMNFWSPTSM